MDPYNYENNGRLINYKTYNNGSHMLDRIDNYSFNVNRYGEFIFIHRGNNIYSHLKGIINRESYAKFLDVFGISEV